MSSHTIVSGVQPTGALHIGNYLGALGRFKSFETKAVSTKGEALFCIVDLHALTRTQAPIALSSSIRRTVASLLACGLNPSKSIIFVQSCIPEHGTLAWILNCVCRMGWLNRMTQFKEKAGEQKEKASCGLWVYPILMAADILLYNATSVPVGEDQQQHLELTRDIAAKFNKEYAPLFNLPSALIEKDGSRVMSLRDPSKKMSKSDASPLSRLELTDKEDMIEKKIRKAVTDSLPFPSTIQEAGERKGIENLLKIYCAVSKVSLERACETFGGGPIATFKEALTECVIECLVPLGKEIRRWEGKRRGFLRFYNRGQGGQER